MLYIVYLHFYFNFLFFTSILKKNNMCKDHFLTQEVLFLQP